MSDSAMGASNVGAILDAYLRALEKGEAPPREELLKQHPQYAADLAAALDGLEFVHCAALELPRASREGGSLPERQLLGDFRLVREVGRGGMAVVYEAEQVSLGRRVALKVLPFAAVLDPKQLQRFKNEALAAAHLHHPHIVPVYAVGCERGVHYYAMQLVEGQSLAAVIREMRSREPAQEPKTPITSHGSNREPGYVRMAVALGMQAAAALDHAHQLGIVHRDVKPGNLLVDGSGELWITDFGLARSIRDGDLTATGELLGTLRYMSPEQTLAKRAPMDHRTDVYSLGATLYELLTLVPAFPGDDPHVVMRDIAAREPVPPRRLNPALPVDLETIVLKAMAKDPSGRYATAQEMAEDLASFLDDRPILARRPSIAARASKWARRHRGFVTAAAVVFFLGMIALAADNVRVGAEEKRTKAALDQATGNLRLARSAVDKFLVEIGVTNMAELPVPKPARQRLLETALQLYERNFDDPASTDTRVMILHGLHRYAEAVALLDRSLEREPSSACAHMQRGHVLWHLTRYDEALAALDRATTIDANLTWAHAYGGNVLHTLGRLQEALAAHDRAIEVDPKVAMIHNNRGNVLADLGRPEDAIHAYESAIELDPDVRYAHDNRGRALAGLGRFDEALAAFDRAIAVDPNDASAYTGRGLVLVSLGRLEDALRSHDRAIEIDPNDAKAQSHRGLVLKYIGRIDDSIAAYHAAIRLDPKLPEPHTNLIGDLLAAGRFDEAEVAIDEAMRLEPASAQYHGNMAFIHSTRREWDAAIRECEEALRLDPRFAEAQLLIGDSLLELNDLDGAIEAYTRALRMRLFFAEDHSNPWPALSDGREPDGAIRAGEEAPSIGPDLPEAHLLLGAAWCRKNDADRGVEHLRAAISILTDVVPADAARRSPRQAHDARMLADAYTKLGSVFRDMKEDPEQAISAYREAIRTDRDSAFAHYELAEQLARSSCDGAEAEAEYREVIRIEPDDARALWSLGRFFFDRGRYRDALPYLRKGHEIGSRRAQPTGGLAESIARAEKMAALEDRLEEVVSAAESPRDEGERIEYALLLCQRRRFRESAEFYAQALAKDASLADDLGSSHRYNAACTAVLAAANGAPDAAAWRKRALGWLRADFAAREKAADRKWLVQWKNDADFKSVRDEVASLPAAERDGWTKLWSEVDDRIAHPH